MDVRYKGAAIRVPDFLIVGAARSGTTLLYSFLARHPRIFMPPEKEPMFFSVYRQDWSTIDLRTGRKATYVVENLADYLNLFLPAKNGQLIGEASTWYLYQYQTTIRNIHEIYGEKARDLKIIVLLRNPAERAWSHYLMKRRDGEENLSFEQAIEPGVVRQRLDQHFTSGFDYVGFGDYFRQVKSYLENFPRVRILLFEEMMRNMARARQDTCEFLGVADAPLTVSGQRLNVSGTPKNKLLGGLGNFIYRPGALKSFLKILVPYKIRAEWKYRLSAKIFSPERMDVELRNQLMKTYREDIQALAGLTNKDLSCWLSATPEEK